MSGAPRAPARRAAAEASGHRERSDRWNGLRAGDPVVVSGLHLRGASWQFRARVLNRHNGTESIEVVGGRPGDRKIRSFEPDRIFAVTGRRGSGQGSGRGSGRPSGSGMRAGPEGSTAGQLSLAEAPQLPLL
jgi:hypothetical protein